jgi:hypothetical protein
VNKALKFGLFAVFISVWLVTILPCSFAEDRAFRGKVLDSDTKEPIEGAVVVAYWDEGRATLAGQSTRLKEVKETLTDKNGEWSINGPKGSPHDPNPIFSFLTGIRYTRTPQFIVFKPGYCPWPEGFSIDACKDKLKPGGNGEVIEGKTVELPKVTEKERRLPTLRIGPVFSYSDDPKVEKKFLKKQLEFLRLLDEENRNLGLSEYGYYKELKNEK